MFKKLLLTINKIFTYLKYKKDRYKLKLLLEKGLKVGKNVYIERDVFIDPNYPYLINIEDDCRIASGTKILAHDATPFKELGITRIAPVVIKRGCFIGENVIILPGVTIGPKTMITAGSVVNRDMGENRVVAGNPARPYRDFSELISTLRDSALTAPIFTREAIAKGVVKYSDILAGVNKNKVAFTAGIPQKDPYYINADIKQIKQTTIEKYKSIINDKNYKYE